MPGFTKEDWDQFSDLMDTKLKEFKDSAEEIATLSSRKALQEFRTDIYDEHCADIDAIKRTLLMTEIPIKIGKFQRNLRVSFMLVISIVTMFIFL